MYGSILSLCKYLVSFTTSSLVSDPALNKGDPHRLSRPMSLSWRHKEEVCSSNLFLGSKDSLKTTPESRGVDPYQHLQSFHDMYYSAHFMTLVVQAKETLDVLEGWVNTIFSPVPNK